LSYCNKSRLQIPLELYQKITEIDPNIRVCFTSAVEVNIEALREVSMNKNEFSRKDVELDKIYNSQSMKYTKRSVLKKIIILGTLLAITLSISALLVPPEYLVYSQSAQVAIVGYLFIEIIANTAFKLALTAQQPGHIAKSIRSLTRIIGSIVIAAIIVSYLSQNAAIAASIGTISGLVVGFASQNLLGNMIAGMYLALTRPFKIGDTITVFGNSGKVYDIGLLNCELLMKNGDIVRAPSYSLLTTPIIILRMQEKGLTTPTGVS
jgi:small-conductance mechanosensitive channel